MQKLLCTKKFPASLIKLLLKFLLQQKAQNFF